MKKRLPVSKEIEQDPNKARFILDTVLLIFILDEKPEAGVNYILNLFQRVETENKGIKELLEQDFELDFIEDEEFNKETKQMLKDFLSNIPPYPIDLDYRPGLAYPLGEDFTKTMGNLVDIATSIEVVLHRYQRLNETFKAIITQATRHRFPDLPEKFGLNIDGDEAKVVEKPPLGVRPLGRP